MDDGTCLLNFEVTFFGEVSFGGSTTSSGLLSIGFVMAETELVSRTITFEVSVTGSSSSMSTTVFEFSETGSVDRF